MTCAFFGGGGSGAPASVSDMADPPVAADGTVIQHTASGKYYIYSSTLGQFVDPRVYAGTSLTKVGEFDGTDATPSGFTVSETASGTITTDGTKLTFFSGTGADKCHLSIPTGASFAANQFYYARGMVEVTVPKSSASYLGSHGIEVSDDTYRFFATMDKGGTSHYPAFVGTSSTLQSEELEGTTVDLNAGEKLMEFYVGVEPDSDLIFAEVWIGGLLATFSGLKTGSAFNGVVASTLDEMFAIGDFTTSAFGTFTARDFVFARHL